VLFDCSQSSVQPFSFCIQQPCSLNKLKCPADRDALIVTWFHKMTQVCPHMDCQCSLCFLLVQSLITHPGNFADIPTPSTGPVSGCEVHSLANSSAVSFPSISLCPGVHISRILLYVHSYFILKLDLWAEINPIDTPVQTFYLL